MQPAAAKGRSTARRRPSIFAPRRCERPACDQEFTPTSGVQKYCPPCSRLLKNTKHRAAELRAPKPPDGGNPIVERIREIRRQQATLQAELDAIAAALHEPGPVDRPHADITPPTRRLRD